MRLTARDAIESLVALLSKYDDMDFSDIDDNKLTLALNVPQTPEERMRTLIEHQGWQVIQIKGQAVSLFIKALDYLCSDNEFEHLTRKEVEKKLSELTIEVLKNQTSFSDDSARRDRIDKFTALFGVPQVEFEVIFSIENLGLMEGDRVRFGGAEFFRFGEEDAENWGFTEQNAPVSGWSEFAIDELSNATAAVVKVRSNNDRTAVDRAKLLVDSSLNALRICTIHFGFRILDEQLMMRRQGFYAIRQIGSSEKPGAGAEFQFGPIELVLDAELRESALRWSEVIAPIYTDAMPEPVRQAFIRAVNWIGNSIRRESHDEKIVDLCTALECFLVTSQRTKSATLALRTVLLGIETDGSFYEPLELLHLYDVRSMVVHGKASNVTGEAESGHLRRLTFEALCQAITLSMYWKVDSLEAFHRKLEREENVTKVKRYLSRKAAYSDTDTLRWLEGHLGYLVKVHDKRKK